MCRIIKPIFSQICRFHGELLLEQTLKFNLDDFLQVWQSVVPDGLQCRLKQLNGCVVVNRGEEASVSAAAAATAPGSIWLLRREDLTDASPQARITELCKQKLYWEQDELEAFLAELVPPESTVSQLVANLCRPCRVGPQRELRFTSRYSL